MSHPREMKSLTLAYLGDAVYELYVRAYLIEQGEVKPQRLHQDAIRFVSAKAQAKTIISWLETSLLTDTEAGIVRRARNTRSNVPKSTDPQTYRYSTAFEALIGYLYLNGEVDRLENLITMAIMDIAEGS